MALVTVATALGALLAWQVFLIVSWPEARTWVGFDFHTYANAAGDWLAGRGFYEGYQLAGPYPIEAREILYPPPVLLLLTPFTVFPAVLWWAVPLAIVAGVVWSLRPSAWGWVAILACLTLPFPKGMSWAEDVIFNGNPAMWIAAAVALAVRFPASGPWVLLKPTLAPFALIGIRRRSWWVGLAVFVGACLLFAPMWPDYLTVLRNAQGSTPLYSLANVTLLAIPLVAWASRRAAPGRSPATAP